MNKKAFVILLQFVLILVLITALWRPYQVQHEEVNSVSTQMPGFRTRLETLSQHMDHLESEITETMNTSRQLQTRLLEFEKQSLNTRQIPKTVVTEDKASGSRFQPGRYQFEPLIDDLTMQHRLIEQGLDIGRVGKLQKYIDKRRSQRERLMQQAMHRRKLDSGAFIENMFLSRDISKGVRERFGDKVYDHYLFAVGRSNRVMVRETLPGSIAESAGVVPGDIIIRYDYTPIYSSIDLRRAYSQGLAGIATLVEIQRDNQPYTLTVPKGPLGVLLDYTRLKPAS